MKIEITNCFNTDITNSMNYDSGFNIGSAKVTYNDTTFYVYIIAQGHVKVDWNDETYKCASQMPEELYNKFKNYDLKDVVVDENNWWEFVILDKDSKFFCSDYIELDEVFNEDNFKSYITDYVTTFCK